MLKKIIGIRNVGRFVSSALPGNPTLAKHTLIFGGNGFGKTTFCAVLRSLATGDPAYISGRKTLGVAGYPEVEFLIDDGVAKFQDGAWSRTVAEIAVYDGQFIAENVHSGDVVDLEHKRAFYRVIIGKEGIGLAQEDERLAGESRAKTGDVRTAERAVQTHVPQGLGLDEFLKLPADPEIDGKITEQEKTVNAVRQSSEIQSRPSLREIAVPVLPSRLTSLLAQSLDGIAGDTERRVSEHLASHAMTERGEAWLADGMARIAKENCPFCGQSIHGLPLIAAYRGLFSDAYNNLKADVQKLRGEIDGSFGDRAIGAINTLMEQNLRGIEFWSRYSALSADTLGAPRELAGVLESLRKAALALIDRKARAPLDIIEPDPAFIEASRQYEQVRVAAAAYNAAVRSANAAIAEKKASTGTADIKAAETTLIRLQATKTRHMPEIAQACAMYVAVKDEKTKVDEEKTIIRDKLEAYSRRVIRPYEKRINGLLDDFNAGFRITEMAHTSPGGVATSSYQLVINKMPIDIGDGKTPLDRPSFKNTLSGGDRSTLALAFFLADLERDPDRKARIVVFDDPMNSQDAFRRRQTIHEINKIGRDCAQVIVLSHDAGFLRQIWEKCPADGRVAVQLADHRAQGSKITSCDLEEACKGRVASEIDDLQAYIVTGAGLPRDLAKKMRVVLETHCRSTYSGYFDPNDRLGGMVEKIKKAGDQHPAWPIHEELDLINEYSREHHHGDDPTDGVADQIDPTELTGFVRRTLRLANNLQA